ncbi:MAG: undecaprenyldiphospho-muramoylpentapeptide beta-N-acetylglucosaminyltransferase [Armatimonadetes bacterium]|nr:undecaprenyldiphospho-muramoylpentapeptide beta-N-acetylglucosaminyltransferase [Armatimonadota bacterium]
MTGREIRILVTGGGTGGHVTPALAVVQTLREMARGADWTPCFRYVGSAQGVEARLAAEAGIEFVGVQSGKLRRTALFSRRNLGDALRVPVGILQSLAAVRRFRPDVVLATGGYVSVPPVVAAGLLGRPVLIHEQTVQVGLANRIAARFARRIALTFEGALADLPPNLRAKAFVTGNPVRAVLFAGNRARAVARFGFSVNDDTLPTVYITGGAQGAQVINRAVEAVLPELLAGCRIIHQCGAQGLDSLQAAARGLPPELGRRYFVTGFIGEEIGDVFALADLVVGRSGAGTVTEAAATGKPALFIPLVPTGGDEQTRNARRSAGAGAAVIVPQAELDGPRLLSEVRALLADSERRRRMGEAAQTLARPQAARDLARALLELTRVS